MANVQSPQAQCALRYLRETLYLLIAFKFPISDAAIFELGKPKRGDVIVFISPKNGVRLIKRLVAIPDGGVVGCSAVDWANASPDKAIKVLQ